MESRTTAIIAAIAVIALIAVGAGYAYSATTVSTGNTVSDESVSILLTNSSSQPAYTGTTYNLTYDTYNNGTLKYHLNAAADAATGTTPIPLTNISTVTLKSSHAAGEIINSMTMTLSETLVAETGDGYTITVSLTDSSSHTWNGVYSVSNGKSVWTFGTATDDTTKLRATSTGSAYTLTFTVTPDGYQESESSASDYTHTSRLYQGTFDIEFKIAGLS